MKVNISYSVELDKVLEHMHKLYTSEENAFMTRINEINKILGKEYEDNNLTQLVQAVDEYRKLLASRDVKLSDLSNILDGYYKIKFQPTDNEATAATSEESSDE